MSSYILISKSVSDEALEDVVKGLKDKRGIHRVRIQHLTEWDYDKAESIATGWRKLIIQGTDFTVRKTVSSELIVSIKEADQNADHDHPKCIAQAKAMGVPAGWAHNPETYLSM